MPSIARHFLQVVFRLALAACIAVALPLSHVRWGEAYPGDGQKGFGIVMQLGMIGFLTGIAFLLLGTATQFLLRKRRAKAALGFDIVLSTIIIATFIYIGVSVHYVQTVKS